MSSERDRMAELGFQRQLWLPAQDWHMMEPVSCLLGVHFKVVGTLEKKIHKVCVLIAEPDPYHFSMLA